MAKFEKDFFSLDADVIEIGEKDVELQVNEEKIIVSKNLFPKSLKNEKKIKVVFASDSSYEYRLEKRAKDILNEILNA